MKLPTFQLQLPAWLEPFLAQQPRHFPTTAERMNLAIALARQNIAHGTGGPFGAAIFDLDTHELIAPGINLVVASHAAIAHAEMVAITLAQQLHSTHDLGAKGLPDCELVTSTEPCAMCFGAVPWSGVRQLVCGARDEDARAIGFDEGPKLPDWYAHLEARGIRVVRDVCRHEAAQVLRDYLAGDGDIYNGRGAALP